MSRRKQAEYEAVVNRIRHALQQEFPTLHLREVDGLWSIVGTLPISIEGHIVDYYLVEVQIPYDYPRSVPIVRELGLRIPNNKDWHVSNGILCLFMPAERWKYWPRGSDIIDFLRGPVHDFFRSTTYRFKTGKYPFGYRPHGKAGIVEYFQEELGTDNEAIITSCLVHLSRKEIKGHLPCYCGSGKKTRKCHFDKLMDLHEKIDPRVAKQLLGYVRQ